MPWSDFISRHQDVLAACDFFTAEVFTPTGLVTYYVLFFIKLASREVHIGGMAPHPTMEWMKQIARNVTMADFGQNSLLTTRDSIHDLDGQDNEQDLHADKGAGRMACDQVEWRLILLLRITPPLLGLCRQRTTMRPAGDGFAYLT